MSKIPLFESGRATADANGKAVVFLSPQRAFERWQIDRMTVQATSSTLVPECKIYRGAQVESRLVDGTFTGTFDHTDTSLFIQNGERLLAVWTGSDVGAECTITIEGSSIR